MANTPDCDNTSSKHTSIRLPWGYQEWVQKLADREGLNFSQALILALNMAVAFEVLASEQEQEALGNAIDNAEDRLAAKPLSTDEAWRQEMAEKYPRVKGFRDRPKKGCG